MGVFKNIKISDIPTEEIVSLYKNNTRISAIGKKFSVSPGTIRNRLKEAGITPRDNGIPHNWKGGRRKNNKGYVLIYSPDHPRAVNKYVFEHILVWEIVNGRPLPKDYIIHHLNGIKDDNRCENLLATTKQKHHILIEPYKKRIRELELKIEILSSKRDLNLNLADTPEQK